MLRFSRAKIIATLGLILVGLTLAVPSFFCNSASSFRICACTVTSSAVVGSSAIRMSGSLASAMAIITRWRWPPDIS